MAFRFLLSSFLFFLNAVFQRLQASVVCCNLLGFKQPVLKGAHPFSTFCKHLISHLSCACVDSFSFGAFRLLLAPFLFLWSWHIFLAFWAKGWLLTLLTLHLQPSLFPFFLFLRLWLLLRPLLTLLLLLFPRHYRAHYYYCARSDSAGTLIYLTTVLLLSLSVNWKQNAL